MVGGTFALQISTVMKKLLVCAALSGMGSAGLATALELFVDPKTQQVYAEPGEGRVRLGRFTAVDEAAPAPAAAAPTAEAVRSVVAAEVRDQMAQQKLAEQKEAASKPAPFSVRGYAQLRYADVISGDEGVDLWTDRSVGDRDSINGSGSFLIRRGRLVFSGDLGQYFSYYIQPDFASAAGTTDNVLQLRDAYFDVALDRAKVHRFRLGQSKVPFGFENLQSSQNRIPLDRADALNSGVRDERDLGVFYYYTPSTVQALFKEIAGAGLKHSGNYGMFGLGVYNGQGSNRRDANDSYHTVARFTYPMKLDSGQFLEFGVQGYRGRFVPNRGSFRNSATGGAVTVANPADDLRLLQGFRDERVALSAVMYPQPFGLQAEWTWGRTPGLDASTRLLDEEDLDGGYVQAMMKVDAGRYGTIFPFLRWQTFDGFNKAELNAPRNRVDDWELGVEWQINKQVELTAVYHLMDRNNLVTGNRAGRVDYTRFNSDVLRVQVQASF